MHPSGVQFGLSRGLLIESISTDADSRPVSSRLWRSASGFCCSGPIRIAGRAKDPHSTRGAPGRSLRLESDL